MTTYTCGFCGGQVPIDDDAGHVNGMCATRYEISPREREDEAERDRRDFDTEPEEDDRRDPQPRLQED